MSEAPADLPKNAGMNKQAPADLPKNAGMNKQDINAALAERLDLMTKLGESATLEDEWGSEADSDESEEDEQEDDDGDDELGEEERAQKKKEKKEAKAKAKAARRASQLPSTTFDTTGIRFSAARARFSGEKPQPGSNEGETVAGGPVAAAEPSAQSSITEPRRRLPRIRAQVEALESWTEERKAPTCLISKGMVVASDEANVLSRQTKELLEMVKSAVAASADDMDQALPHAVWLPASDKPNAGMVRQLVAAHQASASGHGGGGSSSSAATGKDHGLTYEFDGSVLASAGGWLRLSENEQLAVLQERVKRLGEVLGQEAVPGSDSLASATASLQSRLGALHQAFDDSASAQLQSSVKLLTCDIDVALEEAKRLEALDAEDKAADILGDELVEDMPAERVITMHKEVQSLDHVASNIGNLERELASKEHVFNSFASFAQDLAGAEQRLAHTKLLLQRTLSAAQTMKKTVETNKDSMLRNVAAIEKKIADRAKANAALEAQAAAAASVEKEHKHHHSHKKKDKEPKEVAKT